VVLHWAVPRARFWEEMEARGIRVVWDGEARDFRERLHKAIEFRLGLGPTGRLLHAYVPRPEEEEILRFLRERVWGPEKQYFGVVVASPPVAGKTRTAMELVIRLNLPFVLVWPRGRKEGLSSFPSGVALPVRRAVVLADDLPLRPGGEGSSLPEELTALLSACPGLALIATARQDRIPPDVRGVRVVTLQEMSWNLCLEQLAQEVARAEGRPLAEVRRRFTGHPGSLVAGLEVFQQLYDQLPEEMGRVLGVQESARRDQLGEIGQRFLQAARALVGPGGSDPDSGAGLVGGGEGGRGDRSGRGSKRGAEGAGGSWPFCGWSEESGRRWRGFTKECWPKRSLRGMGGGNRRPGRRFEIKKMPGVCGDRKCMD
jgi:hypothetical protein